MMSLVRRSDEQLQPRFDYALAQENQTAGEHVRFVPHLPSRSEDTLRVAVQLQWRVLVDSNIPRRGCEEYVEPLMGWTASADPEQSCDCDLSFTSAEAACALCPAPGLDCGRGEGGAGGACVPAQGDHPRSGGAASRTVRVELLDAASQRGRSRW